MKILSIALAVLLPVAPALWVGGLLVSAESGWRLLEVVVVYVVLLAAEFLGLGLFGRRVRRREEAARVARQNARIRAGRGMVAEDRSDLDDMTAGAGR